MECMENAKKILSEKSDVLHRLATMLIEKESLNAMEIDAIIGQNQVVTGLSIS